MNPSLKYEKYFAIEEFLPEAIPIITEFICHFCEGVYKEPTMDSCGDIYCKRCIEACVQTSAICPKTGQKLKLSELVPMNYIQNIILKQLVYCKNKIHGCVWSGKVNCFKEHMENECMKVSVSCGFIECGTMMFKEDLNYHMMICEYRKVYCEYCSEEVAYIFLTVHVENFCQKIKIECTNHCGLEIERGALESHIESFCENTVIKCPLEIYGCNKTMLRKELKSHRSDLDHNLKIIQYFDQLNDSLSKAITKSRNEYNYTSHRLKILEEKLNVFLSENNEKTQKSDNSTGIIKPLENRVLQTNNETNSILEKAKIRVEKNAKFKREREKLELINPSKRFEEVFLENDNFLDVENGQFDENRPIHSNNKIKIKKVEKINSIFKKNLKVVILKDNHQISLTEWKFNYEENVFGFGMCLKEVIVKNNFQIINNKGSPHGCFIISSTGLLLSSSNEQENLREVNNFRKIEINEEIRIISHLLVNEIVVKIKDQEYKFTKVCLNDRTLVPCKVLIVDR